MLSILLSAVLAITMVPAVALAAPNEDGETNQTETNQAPVVESTGQDVISSEEAEGLEVEKSAPIEQNGDEVASDSFGEDEAADNATGGENLVIPAATQRVNEDVTLSSRTIAQAESTRSYFLAQTLESTRTVPIVSANLPLDTSAADVAELEGEDDPASEDEGGEDSDESDPAGTPIAAESVVVGSFEYRGITYAVEPGGESVAVVASDYAKLPEEFIEAQVIVLPSMVTSDGLDYYTVTRIADKAFFSVIPSEDEEGITAIAIPASITSIGDDAFTGFDTLQYVIVSEDNPVYGMYDGCLYDADLTRLLLIPGGRLGAVCIAPSVETIDPEVFSHTGITEVAADADSAAYQLLSGGDFYNVSDKHLEVISEKNEAEKAASVSIEFSRSLYAEAGEIVNLAQQIGDDAISEKKIWCVSDVQDSIWMKSKEEIQINTSNPVTLLVKTVGSNGEEKLIGFDIVRSAWQTSMKQVSERLTEGSWHGVDQTKECWVYPKGYKMLWARKYGTSPGNAGFEQPILYEKYGEFTDSRGFEWEFTYGSPWPLYVMKDESHGFYGVRGNYSTHWLVKDTVITDEGTLVGGNLYQNATFYENAICVMMSKDPFGVPLSEGATVQGDEYCDIYYHAGCLINWDSNSSETIKPGSTPKPENMTVGEVYASGLPVPDSSKRGNGWRFAGWYTDESWTTKVDATTIIPAHQTEITFHARWECDVYWDANGGVFDLGLTRPSSVASVAYAADKSAVACAPEHVPTRAGYVFDGWYDVRAGGAKLDGVTQSFTNAAPGRTYYAHWKYKVVLDLDTRDGDNNVVLNGDAYDASFDGMDGYATEYITVQDKPVKVHTFTAIDGDAITLPVKVSRTGYEDATAWDSAGGSTGLSGTLSSFYPGNQLVATQASAGDFGGKALVLRPVWTTTGAHGETIPASKTYTVTLQGRYGDFAPTNAYTTSINALYDAPLLMEHDGKVIVYADYVKENRITEVAAPVIKDGTEFRYVFNGYYTEQNGLDMPEGGWNGTECIGATPTTANEQYAGSSVAPTNVLFRTDGPLTLYALWNRVESRLVLDLQGGEFLSAIAGVDESAPFMVEGLKLTANEDVVELPGLYAQVPHRDGYRFKGYYTKATDLTGADAPYATYAETASTKAYYMNNGTAVAAESAKWPFYTNTVLYAHWEYDIECALVHADDCASNPEGQHASVGLKSGFAEGVNTDKYGNVYPSNGSFGTESAPFTITALAGVPVKLPYAQNRNGYSDSDSWNRNDDTSYANASTGYTASAVDALYGMPDSSKKMTLRVDWTGKQKLYWVQIVDSALLAEGAPVTDSKLGSATSRYVKATFDAPLPVSGLSVSTDADEDRNLAFLGYFAEPASIGGAEATRYVKLSGAEDTPALAADALFSPKGRSVWDASDAEMKLESALVKEGAGAVPTTEKPIRIFAQWGYPICRITFDMGGGAVGTHALPKVEDAFAVKTNDEMPLLSSLTGDAEALGTLPNKKSAANVGDATDYDFAGYWIGGTCYYSADLVPLVTTWDRVGDATLTARWTYDIAYEANAKLPQGAAADSDYWDHDMLYANGSALQPVRDVVDGTSPAVTRDVVRMRGTAPTGYSFAGWYTDATCESGVAYNADGTLATELAPVDGTATLYAKWTPATYEVMLAASGYTGFVYGSNLQTVVNDSGENVRTKSVTATYDCPLPTDAIVVPDMRGYSFLGYFVGAQRAAVNEESDPTPYSPVTPMFYSKAGVPQANEPWTSTTNAVLYAHYRQIPYTITFALDEGATGKTDPVSVFYGYDLTKAATHKASKNGSTFGGWKDPATNTVYFDRDGNGTDRYRLDRSIELVPVWTSKTYSITWTFNWDYKDDEEATIASWHHEKARPDDETFDGEASHTETVSYGDPIELLSPVSRAYVLHGWYTGAEEAYAHGAEGNAVGKVFQADPKNPDGYVFAPADDSGPVDVVLFAGWDHDPIDYRITLTTSGHRSSFAGGATTKTLPNAYSATVAHNDLYDDVVEKNVPSATQAGWKFGGWIETTDGGSVPLTEDDRYVPRGTGNRTFEAVWVVTDAEYSVSFDKGDAVRGDASVNFDAVGIKGSAKRFFSAEGPTDDKGELALPTLTPTTTLGYDFAGWFRAERDATTGALAFTENETELTAGFSAQDLVDIADRYGNDLVFMAKWTPKQNFEVRYRWSTDDAEPAPMDESAYDGRPVSYTAEVKLASPAFEQTGKSGYVFQYWDGIVKNPARTQKLLPGREITVRDLVHELGKTSVETTADGRNIVWLEPVWLETYSFTVPLRVDIIVDPERPVEGTKVTEGLRIKTTSPSELFVESVAFSRAENVSTTLQAGNDDRSSDVYLTLMGDGANATEPLKMNLGANAQKVYYGVDEYGLGTLDASKPIELTYGIGLNETADRLTFGDFENLLGIKDVYAADKKNATYELGRVHYTLSLSSLCTSTATAAE